MSSDQISLRIGGLSKLSKRELLSSLSSGTFQATNVIMGLGFIIPSSSRADKTTLIFFFVGLLNEKRSIPCHFGSNVVDIQPTPCAVIRTRE